MILALIASATAACTTYGPPRRVGRVGDPTLIEISGIAVSQQHPGTLWLHEDSGRPAVLTATDETGATNATITLLNAENRDWEDLALGPCGDRTCLFVADIGDNAVSRSSITIYRLPEPDPTAGDQAIAPERFTATYPDGPHNAEALVVTPDGLPLIVTKGQEAALYAFPTLEEGPVELVRVGTVDATRGLAGFFDLVTAADLSADGALLAVRTYGRIWLYPRGGDGTERRAVRSRWERQGEALALGSGGLWHVSEGRRPALYRLACIQ
ncbi:MAG: hypothetical protein ACI8S6_000156 [Myxococcota bacterium]